MKSKLCIAFLLACGFISAEAPVQEVKPVSETVLQDFGYFSAGLGPMPILLPAFSGGYRMQSGHHGADFSLQVQTVVGVTQLKANLLYHHYFKPSLCSEFYVGGGVGPSVLLGKWNKEAFLVSPEFVFGKQYRNDDNDIRFFQMQVSFPTFDYKFHRHHSNHVFWFPLMVVSYGIGF